MLNIETSHTNAAGSELLMDSESFLHDLNDTDAMALQGGEGAKIHELLQFGLSAYKIKAIASISKSFSGAKNVG